MQVFPSIRLIPRLHRNIEVNFNITDTQYSIQVARTEDEVDEALRMRFEVFNLELKEGLDSSYLTFKDEDKFDKQCDHLIIRDNSTGNVIGTYRMQTWEMAKRGVGFYSDGEYCLYMLGKKILHNSLELGRACILKEYRNTRVLFLLWRGIANYSAQAHKRYLFGCCSITSQDSAEGNALYADLLAKGHIHKRINLEPRNDYKLEGNEVLPGEPPEMPPLMKMYLRYGAKIVGKPAIDREFKTINYFVLLDLHKLSTESFRMFLGE